MKELVEASQRGESGAYSALVKRTQHMALAYAFSQLGDFHQAQDVVQDAFVTAHAQLHRLKHPAAFAGWLRTIVHYGCQRIFRHRPLLSLAQAPEQIEHDQPAELVEQAEASRTLQAAIKTLSPHHRTIVTLYYLEELSQREVASFLSIPASRVNNILHEARKQLKRRLKTMSTDTFQAHRLTEEFAQTVGEIIELQGPFVDTLHKDVPEPRVFDVLAQQSAGPQEEGGFVVMQRLRNGRLRCLRTSGTATNHAPLYRAGGHEEALRLHRDERLADALVALRQEEWMERIVPTGIKVIDLFCPLPAGGTVGIFGKEGVGRAVLVMELLHRKNNLKGPLSIAFFSTRWNAPGTQDMLLMEPAFATDIHEHIQTAWLLHPKADDALFARDTSLVDVSIFCSPLLATRQIWPAVDPLYSTSQALTPALAGARHVELATRARALLREGRALTRDPAYLEYLAMGAYQAAAQRRAETWEATFAGLSVTEQQMARRAQRLEWYLTQPFEVGREYTGLAGETVPLQQTLLDVERLLEGGCDDWSEEQLMWSGALSG